MKKIRTVSIIGSGNVAHFIGTNLRSKGLLIRQVWSRSLANSELLAGKLEASSTDSLKDIKVADLIIVAVVDDAILSVVEKLSADCLQNSIIAHTSGSTSAFIYSDISTHPALFYPLNTFSKDDQPKVSETPFYINAEHQADIESLKFLISEFGSPIHHISEEQRKALHVAAVFASNFSNAMYTIASELLNKAGMDLSHLYSLINHTSKKVTAGLNPRDAQTGPAIRNDEKTIKKHLDLLKASEKQKEIYQLLSLYINNKLNL